MNRRIVTICVGLALAALAWPLASTAKDVAAHKAVTAQYMLISPHTAEQCMHALDDAKAAGSLARWNFGCMDGDHTGYLIVSAANAEEALKNVPADERPMAKAIKMHHFTAAELKGLHEKMAAGK